MFFKKLYKFFHYPVLKRVLCCGLAHKYYVVAFMFFILPQYNAAAAVQNPRMHFLVCLYLNAVL